MTKFLFSSDLILPLNVTFFLLLSYTLFHTSTRLTISAGPCINGLQDADWYLFAALCPQHRCIFTPCPLHYLFFAVCALRPWHYLYFCHLRFASVALPVFLLSALCVHSITCTFATYALRLWHYLYFYCLRFASMALPVLLPLTLCVRSIACIFCRCRKDRAHWDILSHCCALQASLPGNHLYWFLFPLPPALVPLSVLL